MQWHPPLGTGMTTMLVIVTAAVMVGSFVWSRRELDIRTPAGALAAALRAAAFLLVLFLLLQPTRLPRPHKQQTRRTLAVLLDSSASMTVKPMEATARM